MPESKHRDIFTQLDDTFYTLQILLREGESEAALSIVDGAMCLVERERRSHGGSKAQ